MNTLFWKLGAFSAGSSIAIQAVGGHKPWSVEKKIIFSRGWEIQFSSAVGLMILGTSRHKGKLKALGGISLLVGSLIFSGLIYYRCFTDDKSYNYLMPYGGGTTMLGWLMLLFI